MSVSAAVPRCPDFPTTCVFPRVVPDGFASTLDPLGSSAEFASPPPSRSIRGQVLADRFTLFAAAKELTPYDEHGERSRIWHCLRTPRRDVSMIGVWHQPRTKSGTISGTQTCGSVWGCPVCAAKIAERRCQEVAAGIAAHRAAGGVVLAVALTFRHGRRDDLADILGRFLAALRAMQSGAPWVRFRDRWGVNGMIRSIECTWGMAHGYHPHAHFLFFIDPPRTLDQVTGELVPVADWWPDVSGFHDAIYDRWEAVAGRQGFTMDEAHGVVVQSTAAFDAAVVAEYVAKHGQEPTRQRWSAAHEVTKGHVKRGKPGRLTPWDFLRRFVAAETPKERSAWAARWREYLAAFRGMAQLRWSRKLRERLGLEIERSDAEVAAERAEDGVLLALLYLDQWRAVWATGKVPELLDAAATGDAAAVWQVVAVAVAVGARAGP